MLLPVGVVVCMPGQYQVFLPLAAIIDAGRRDMLATGQCRHSRDFCPFTQQAMVNLTKILGWIVHTGDCTAQFIQNMFYGGSVWRSCRLLHLGDVALLKKVKDYPSPARCGVIVLIAVIITKMLPGKWQNAHVELTGEVSVGEHKRRFDTTVKSSQRHVRTTTSSDSISLALLLEAPTR